jgi:hypothetical protein
MASDILPPTDSKGKSRNKVALKPGFHLMDWMRLTQQATDISGRKGLHLPQSPRAHETS